MTNLNIWNTSYDQKKSRKSNWQFDSRPLKVKNRPNLLANRWCVIYHWIALDEGYNFALYIISIQGLHMNLWAPKVVRVPTLTILKLSLGSPGTKCPSDVRLLERRKVYYKGEGGGFPQVWAVASLVSLSCPWFVLTPKVLQLCTTHLVLVLCKFVWVVEAYQFFLVLSWSSSTPLYPSKVLRAKEHTSTPYSSVVPI